MDQDNVTNTAAVAVVKPIIAAVLKLLKSGNSRAVVRISNTRVVCQVISWQADGDKVEVSVTGDDLVSRYGWPESNSRKNIPASYLTGYALGKSALSAGHDEAVLDIGLAASTNGNRVFAALKGMVDAGLGDSSRGFCPT